MPLENANKYTNDAMKKLHKICSELIHAVASNSHNGEQYSRELRKTTRRYFPSDRCSRIEHVVHWIMRDCGLTYETEYETKVIIKPQKTPIKEAVQKYEFHIRHLIARQQTY